MSDYYGYIYKTTNLINGKIYIGQSTAINNKKYLGSGRYILKAIKKYGRENFKKEILCYCLDIEGLNIQEIYFIAFYKNQGYKMYNITSGGDGVNGYKHSSEIKNFLSERMKGEKNRYYNIPKEQHPCYGIKYSEERCKKMSEQRKGEKNYNYGKKVSPELRKKFILLNSGKNNNMYGKKYENNPNSIPIYQIDLETDEIIKRWNSTKQAADFLNIDPSGITKALKGKQAYSKGFKWKYANYIP